MATMGSHQSAAMESAEWLTPPEIILALGPFDLDPCCPSKMPWETAKKMINLPIDGLCERWYGRVWLNPPYSIEARQWLAKMAGHGKGTALVFARTETEWFWEHIWLAASALFFLRGRLHFYHVDGTRAKANAGAPSVLAAYGDEDAARLAVCSLEGRYVDLRR